jgi:predicted metal-dependent TIM-barrel fold hydrolase
VHPRDGLDARRAAALARRYGPDRLLVGSGADWDESDCLAVPAVAAALADAGLSEAEIGRLLWENPARFYAQSGRLDLSPSADGPREAAAR